MQILIPISSRTPFFDTSNYFYPKPLIEVGGKPLLLWVIQNLKSNYPKAEFLFVVDQELTDSFSIDTMLEVEVGSEIKVIIKKAQTAGALCSCLLASDELRLDEPLLVVNSDIVINADLRKYTEMTLAQKHSSCLITFDSVHPKWSYAEQMNGVVSRTAEKRVISRNAIAGFYFYETAEIFMQAAFEVVVNDIKVDGNYYISSTINQLILAGKTVSQYEVHQDCVHSLASPAGVKNFEDHILAKDGNFPSLEKKLNIILPAAGKGSRFQNAGWTSIKPFIDVGGKPMIGRVLDNLVYPGGNYTVILSDTILKDYRSEVKKLSGHNVNFSAVKGVTEGTACTVLSQQCHILNDQPLVIANSDQICDFDFTAFVNDCIDRELDGSILVFKNKNRDPKWSFAQIDKEGYVIQVAEKQPISDYATVGIYMFRRGSDFVTAAIDMIVANDRVNGEFYTCPVYNYLIAKGAKIGIYEIPPTSMHGLGIPEDLNAFLKRKSYARSLNEPTK